VSKARRPTKSVSRAVSMAMTAAVQKLDHYWAGRVRSVTDTKPDPSTAVFPRISGRPRTPRLFRDRTSSARSGAPWLYNTLEFTTVRHDVEVHCRITPSYGKITTQLMVRGQELVKFELRDAETISLIVNGRQEVLVATFAPKLRLDNFALQLKPRVWAAWGNFAPISLRSVSWDSWGRVRLEMEYRSLLRVIKRERQPH
jgi:hypothetical protein